MFYMLFALAYLIDSNTVLFAIDIADYYLYIQIVLDSVEWRGTKFYMAEAKAGSSVHEWRKT